MTEKSRKVNESQIDFLKPCPCCGGEPKTTTNMWDAVIYPDVTTEYTVMCQSCDHKVTSDVSMEDAADGWNRSMKCWYTYGEVCDRPPGICEGCQKYEDWRRQRNESQLMGDLKKKAEQYDGYPPNIVPESIWKKDIKKWKGEKE